MLLNTYLRLKYSSFFFSFFSVLLKKWHKQNLEKSLTLNLPIALELEMYFDLTDAC